MKLKIDSDLCTGHGRCYAIAPELFTDDDAGYGVLIGDGNVDGDRVANAERAVAGCPERAISIVR